MKNLVNDNAKDHELLGMEKDPKSKGNHAADSIIKMSFGLIGRLPNYKGNLVATKRANRYLAFQELRIKKALKAKDFKKVVILWICLLKCSKAYQVLLFHRVTKTGYGRGNTETTEAVLFKTMNKIRRCDFTLLIRRFYIEKKNGKLRPIGCPDGSSRIISKSLTDLVYACTKDIRFEDQHAYRGNHGTGSACLSIIEKLEKGMKGYEFDLKSFFNTVEPGAVWNKLDTIDHNLAPLISKVIRTIVYRFNKIEPEYESEIYITGEHRGLELRERKGMPQGLSLSPVLATLALEWKKLPKNTVLYADDGIYFYEDTMDEFIGFMEEISATGISIAFEKSGELKERFKFCGFTFDRKEKTIEYDGHKLSGKDKALKSGLKTVTSYYGKKPSPGSWDVNKDSFISHYRHNLSWLDLIITTVLGVGSGKMWKGHRYFFGRKGIVPILYGSSFSCNELLKIVKYKRAILTRYGRYDLTDYSALHYTPRKHGQYRNYLNKGNCDNKGVAFHKRYYEIMLFFDGRTGSTKWVSMMTVNALRG